MQREAVFQNLQAHFPFLLEEDLMAIWEISSLKTFKNKTTILGEGKFATYYYFIVKGMVRGTSVDQASGEEHTNFLKPAMTFISAPEAIETNTQTKYTLEAVGETVLLELPIQAFEQLVYERPAIAQYFILGLKEVISTLIFRVEMLSGKVPEERYEAMLERFPQFFQQAYNKHIANYLGITPTSLSRIIRRKKGKKDLPNS